MHASSEMKKPRSKELVQDGSDVKKNCDGERSDARRLRPENTTGIVMTRARSDKKINDTVVDSFESHSCKSRDALRHSHTCWLALK